MAIFTLIAFMLPLCVVAGIVEWLCGLPDRRRAKREWKYIRERYYPEQQY